MSALMLASLSSDSEMDLATLQGALEGAPGYWSRVSAQPAGPEAARETFEALPEGKTYTDKHVLAIRMASGQTIGCVDLIRGFPAADTAMLGLLLLIESEQGRGLGRAAYDLVEGFVLEWPEIVRVRIGVVATNSAVLPFWEAMGFVETGRRPYEDNGVTSETIVMEKRIREAV